MEERFHYYAKDQIWTNEILLELRTKYLVIFNRGVFGIRIIPMENNNPLFELLGEDDGHLFSEESSKFDMHWSNDLISVVNDAVEYWNEIKDKVDV